MKVLGLIGWSGSGKTTLMLALIEELRRRGVTLSTMKHTHHDIDLDTPGKDSYEHRHAGAEETVLAGPARWTLIHECRDEGRPRLETLLERMAPVDLVLIEGFKEHPIDKLEVHRPAHGKPLICVNDPRIVAVATDAPLDGVSAKVLDLNDAGAVADFVMAHCGLEGTADA